MIQYVIATRDVACTGVAALAAYSTYGPGDLPGPGDIYETVLPAICSLAHGTWPIDWTVGELIDTLWEITIRSLAGLGIE